MLMFSIGNADIYILRTKINKKSEMDNDNRGGMLAYFVTVKDKQNDNN